MPLASHSGGDSITLDLVNDRAAIDAVREQIVEELDRHGYSGTASFAVRLAFEEAVSNAFHHGHRDLPASTPVTVRYRVSPEEVEIAVRDRGPGFCPGEVPDPTRDENIELPSGRGLMLIRAYMARVEFNAPGNEIRMVYRPRPGR